MATPTLPRLKARTLQAPLPFRLHEVARDRYEIRRLIGEGPLGIVYVAHDRATEVDLALKVIRPPILPTESHRETFLEAMKRVHGVGHSHLNHVIDVDQDGERCFFTAPLLEGLSLRKLMALRRGRSERFTLAEVVPIAAQVADALEAGARVAPHGDLKPDNVIIMPETLKVTDFGLAMALAPSAFVPAQRGAVESAQYLSPEVREHARPGSRSDLYSLGVMLLELLTGTVATEPPVRLRDVQVATPEALESLLNRLLSGDPAARPTSMEEVLQELAAAESGITRGAVAPPVRRTFAAEQTQRLSLDMLEEVVDAVDEEAFAASIAAHAASIDRQTAEALVSDGLTDPTVRARDSRPDPVSADVTQKLTADMIELVLGEEPTGRSRTRPQRRHEPLGDELDPRLVRAALGVELDETDGARTEPTPALDEPSDPTVQEMPAFPEDPSPTSDKTEQMVPLFQESTEPTLELRTTTQRRIVDSKKTIPDRPPRRSPSVPPPPPAAPRIAVGQAARAVPTPAPRSQPAAVAGPAAASRTPAREPVVVVAAPVPRAAPTASPGRPVPVTTLPGHGSPLTPPATPLLIAPEPRAASSSPEPPPAAEPRSRDPAAVTPARPELPPGAIAAPEVEPIEESRRRHEPTRIVPRFEERRSSSGIWVWVALAIGASAFLVGAGFYWRRLRADQQHRLLQQIMLEHQQQQPPRQQALPPAPAPTPTGATGAVPPQEAPGAVPSPAPGSTPGGSGAGAPPAPP